MFGREVVTAMAPARSDACARAASWLGWRIGLLCAALGMAHHSALAEPGDLDGNGAVDAADFGAFHGCFSGTGPALHAGGNFTTAGDGVSAYVAKWYRPRLPCP